MLEIICSYSTCLRTTALPSIFVRIVYIFITNRGVNISLKMSRIYFIPCVYRIQDLQRNLTAISENLETYNRKKSAIRK